LSAGRLFDNPEDIFKLQKKIKNQKTVLEIKEDDAPLSDDDRIEMVEQIVPVINENSPQASPIQSRDGEQIYESFVLPDSDGFSIDFIQKSNDTIRRNFLSKLTYQKIWLTPL